MRRYAYEPQGGAFLNVLLFYCPRDPKSFSVLNIVIPKNYSIKSFPKESENPKLPIRILTDNTSTWHFEADYKNGEMFVDRTPTNYPGFDAVMNARELLIGFGVGDALYYRLTPNMDAFMKEASAALGSGSTELGDITFLDRIAAKGVCREFQAGKYGPRRAAQTSSTGKFWVVRGTVSCPDCDSSKGKTSVDVKISKEKNGNIFSEAECKKVLNTYRSALMEKAKTVNLAIDLHCVRVSDPNVE